MVIHLTTLHITVMLFTALHCNVLHITSLHCTVTHFTALNCTVLCCTINLIQVSQENLYLENLSQVNHYFLQTIRPVHRTNLVSCVETTAWGVRTSNLLSDYCRRHNVLTDQVSVKELSLYCFSTTNLQIVSQLLIYRLHTLLNYLPFSSWTVQCLNWPKTFPWY